MPVVPECRFILFLQDNELSRKFITKENLLLNLRNDIKMKTAAVIAHYFSTHWRKCPVLKNYY